MPLPCAPMEKVAVIGAGSWGTTVALLASKTTATLLWARRPELAEEIRSTRRNEAYLPGIDLPDLVVPTGDMEKAVAGGHALRWTVPSHEYRATSASLCD